MNVVSIDPHIQGGVPCFRGTRVPVSSLLDHLEQGFTIDEFISDFPTVTHDQAIAALELAKASLREHAQPLP
jgi:uncharacterized protein (DUF433 family)